MGWEGLTWIGGRAGGGVFRVPKKGLLVDRGLVVAAMTVTLDQKRFRSLEFITSPELRGH